MLLSFMPLANILECNTHSTNKTEFKHPKLSFFSGIETRSKQTIYSRGNSGVWEEHRLKVAGKYLVRTIFGRTEGIPRMGKTKLFSEQRYN
jgi:hypothetical protein